jgi:hypothetical protein
VGFHGLEKGDGFFDRMDRIDRMFWKMFPEVNPVNPDILSKKMFRQN